jgi:hypothetical protein
VCECGHAAGAGAWRAACMRLLDQRRHAAGVACLSAGGSAMESEANERLCEATRDGDVAGIAAALLAGADPNAFEGTQVWTPLHCAAAYDHVAAIAALLAAGAHVDGVNMDGTTPLMYTAIYGRRAAMDALVAAGADVRRANNLGHTALHWASVYGRVDTARVLLDAGVRSNVRSNNGKRPIDVVRAPHRSLVAAARLHYAASPFAGVRADKQQFQRARPPCPVRLRRPLVPPPARGCRLLRGGVGVGGVG